MFCKQEPVVRRHAFVCRQRLSDGLLQPRLALRCLQNGRAVEAVNADRVRRLEDVVLLRQVEDLVEHFLPDSPLLQSRKDEFVP